MSTAPSEVDSYINAFLERFVAPEKRQEAGVTLVAIFDLHTKTVDRANMVSYIAAMFKEPK